MSLRTYIAILFLLITNFCSAQLIENFNDGDFTNNPTWSGDVSSFTVNAAMQLQSANTTPSSTFYLSTASTAATNAEWELFVNLKFATSGANYVDVFLVSDVADVNNAGNGYFVRIGNTTDEISLYRNDAGTAVKIIDGIDSRLSSTTNNSIKLKVIRDASNLWTLTDSVANATPVVNVEGTVTDATYLTSQFFGISVTQSVASFFTKHYFDSIYAGPIIVDNTPPQLISATQQSINTLDVLFDEPVDLNTSQNSANYTVNKGIGNSATATRDGVNLALVHLSFANNFISDTTYTLTVSNVNDVAGNTITSNNTANFIYTTPKIVAVTVISVSNIDIKFSEPLQQAAAQNTANYFGNNGLGFPSFAARDGSDFSLMHLGFSIAFTDGLLNTITINNLLNLNNGMIAPNSTATFTYFAPVVAVADDIIVNEIMAAPVATLGLPNAEYVELFNRSNKTLNLSNWTLHDATGSSGAFPNVTLAPDSFLIICSSTNVAAMSAYGNAISVSSFPSLNNAGDVIGIYTPQGLKINEVAYDDTWYIDPNKTNNGYSLERIDKNFPCPTSLNWAASNAITGGTPGALNSINALITDTVAPLVLSTYNTDTQTVVINFTEVMDANTLNNVNAYAINGGIGIPITATALPYTNTVTLTIAGTFLPTVLYSITINGVTDCSGNTIAANTIANFSFDLPKISSVTVTSDTTLDIKFTQDMEQISLETISNYSADNGLGNPTAVARDVADFQIAHLTFASPFINALLNTITINNVMSIGNVTIAPNTTATFTYFAATTILQEDIIINELMPSPSDNLGLPNMEYVELYNRSSKNINLQGFTIHDATSSSGPFPNIVLKADSFLIVCSATNQPVLSYFGKAVGLTSFPSLNNASDVIGIYDASSNKINEVAYNDTWYGDPDKTSNGYSLERIDKNFLCPAAGNWTASNSSAGGTPGTINSVNGIYEDIEPPVIKNAFIRGSSKVVVVFNEVMDVTTLSNPLNYNINVIGNPTSVTATLYADSVSLSFNATFQPNAIYTLTINDVKDCAGNIIVSPATVRIAIADTAQPGQILINEILFNAYSGGADFVELYNASNNVFDLSTLHIANTDLAVDTILTSYPITSESYLFFPGEYLAITENANDIKARYQTPNPTGVLQIINLPTYNDDEGKAVLLNENKETIDAFKYNADFHYPLLANVEGVSLERLSFTRPTQDSSNWQSAAEPVGFATPAYKNSQATAAASTNSGITITPEIFSPDEDGYNDVLSIQYQLNEPGLVLNATVYDSRGRLVQYVARNLLLGEDATVSWNGINLDNAKAKIGIYVLYSEVFSTNGDVKKYKNTFVVAGKLE
jgi:hypothetical protein